MSFLTSMFSALLSFLNRGPMSSFKLHADQVYDGELVHSVDPRGEGCGWHCR